jgi:hypothetical protein
VSIAAGFIALRSRMKAAMDASIPATLIAAHGILKFRQVAPELSSQPARSSGSIPLLERRLCNEPEHILNMHISLRCLRLVERARDECVARSIRNMGMAA